MISSQEAVIYREEERGSFSFRPECRDSGKHFRRPEAITAPLRHDASSQRTSGSLLLSVLPHSDAGDKQALSA